MKIKSVKAPVTQPENWDEIAGSLEEVLEIEKTKKNEFTTLFKDNQNRYYLARITRQRNPLDLPWNRFYPVSFLTAAAWVVEVDDKMQTGEGGSSAGSGVELLSTAIKMLKALNVDTNYARERAQNKQRDEQRLEGMSSKPFDPELTQLVQGKTPAQRVIFSHTLERWAYQVRASLGFPEHKSFRCSDFGLS